MRDHTDLVCQPACSYWYHPFCSCSGLFKIYGNQQGCCIYLFSMTPSTINCSFSLSVGLTLTQRQGMELRGLTEVSNWYCLLAVFATVLLHILMAGTSADGRENVWRKMSTIGKKKWNIVAVYARTERKGNTQTQKKTHTPNKQTFRQTHGCMYTEGTETDVWKHLKPLLSGTALKMHDCDFHIMRVISQGGRFSNCPIMIYLAIQ